MGRKSWDPRGMYPRIDHLEKYASQIVGDGKRPDIFFVTVEGNVVVISQDFTIAYTAWRGFSMPPERETALEDRLYGVIASVAPDEEGGRLVRHDDSGGFMSMFPGPNR